MDELKTSLLQWDLIWENPLENLKKAGLLLNKVTQADLVVLPEMFTSGFSMNTKALAEDMNGPSVNWMLIKAQEYQFVIAGSLIIKENNHFFNRMIIAFPDGTIKYYDKRHLFSYAGEDKIFLPGNAPLIIGLNGWRIKMLICYDLRFPVWSRNQNDSDLIVYVANWPASRSYPWNQLLKARAIENLCFVLGVNRIGRDGKDILYDGDTQILDYAGKVMGSLKGQEGILSTNLSKKKLNEFRERFPFLNDRDNFMIKT